MSNVYFIPIDSISKTEEISAAGRKLLETVIEKENVQMEKRAPMKVHFGEKGNVTFIRSENFNGIIDYLDDHCIETCFMETNTLYRGSRTTKESHIALAKEHGFTRKPVVIADGDHGENYEDIEINKKHFDKCKIGKTIADEKQMIVICHFKGHMMAGYGAALKQLCMGCASRGGKLDQHSKSIPILNPLECTKCKTCVKNCPADAITIGKLSRINSKKCIGCAACIAVCPVGAISVNWAGGIVGKFNERMAEYAYAAQKGKEGKNIYIVFAFNLTSHCDCKGGKMEPVARDIGVFASTDPVAIDQAVMDITDKLEGKKVFKGRRTIEYAEEIGLGSTDYILTEIE